MVMKNIIYKIEVLLMLSMIKNAHENTILDSFLSGFRQIQQIEENAQSNILKIIYMLEEIADKRIYDEHYTNPAGSAAEGSASAKLFGEELTSNYRGSYEVDEEYILLKIPKRYKRVVKEITNKTGYVRLHLADMDVNCPECKLRKRNETYHRHNGYFSHYLEKGDSFKRNHSISKINFGCRMIYSILKQVSIDQVYCEMTNIRTKSSVLKSFEIKETDQMAKFHLERALTIKLQWKTELTATWLNRTRNWPNESDIQSEINEGYIVAKTSREEKENKESTELRYSFGHLERKLTSLRSKHQNLVYLIFKSMFYKWLHPIDSDNVTSYLAKTIMLWTCEQYPPDHVMWDVDENSTIKAIKYLFTMLYDGFKKNYLPYYFIPEINVIDHVPKQIITYVSQKIVKILKDIVNFIPNNTKEVFDCFDITNNHILLMVHAFEDAVEDQGKDLLRPLSTILISTFTAT